ncbi:MAG: hypothetical protein WA926_10625 [Methylovirgula sp.]
MSELQSRNCRIGPAFRMDERRSGESHWGQSSECSGHGQAEQRKKKGESVLNDKETFEHAPRHKSDAPSHRVQVLVRPGRTGTEAEGSKVPNKEYFAAAVIAAKAIALRRRRRRHV